MSADYLTIVEMNFVVANLADSANISFFESLVAFYERLVSFASSSREVKDKQLLRAYVVALKECAKPFNIVTPLDRTRDLN